MIEASIVVVGRYEMSVISAAELLRHVDLSDVPPCLHTEYSLDYALFNTCLNFYCICVPLLE